MQKIIDIYEKLAKEASGDLKSESVSNALEYLVFECLDFLEKHSFIVELKSEVINKSYFSFKSDRNNKNSRPVNHVLFNGIIAKEYLSKVLSADVTDLSTDTISKVLYTSALAYCCVVDIVKKEDRKTPGTFFEILVGHLFSKTYGINPERSIQVLNLDMANNLPTDYVFNLGKEKSRIHLPIKTSTRERIIQVWAHQRILDGIYGINRFRGILVCINETNKKTKSNSVVEVCLPGQWVIYQMFIAQLHRIYYLDVPAKYSPLGQVYPFIQVRELSAFFSEASEIISGPMS